MRSIVLQAVRLQSFSLLRSAYKPVLKRPLFLLGLSAHPDTLAPFPACNPQSSQVLSGGVSPAIAGLRGLQADSLLFFHAQSFLNFLITSWQSRAMKATPPARRMRSRNTACSGLNFPLAAFTSTPIKRPSSSCPITSGQSSPAKAHKPIHNLGRATVHPFAPCNGRMRSQRLKNLL